MTREQKRIVKSIQAMDPETRKKTIQAMDIEGVDFKITLETLLDATAMSSTGGEQNDYKSYSKQVRSTYKKYNNEEEDGGAQVRAIVNIRSGFIAGEKLSVSGKKLSKGHRKFLEMFMDQNKLTSSKFYSLVKRLEMTGKAVTSLKKLEADNPVPYFGVYTENENLVISAKDKSFPDFNREYKIKDQNGFKKPLDVKYPVLIITGGTGEELNNTTTKVGVVLNECDNYSRALKNIRTINHNAARITPTFKTQSQTETNQITAWLNDNGWKRGEVFIGTAELSYKSPDTGAISNLVSEIQSNGKVIMGTTGVPVHWLGHVDMMSNRATAEELYQLIYNATREESAAIEAAFKEIFINAQKMYLDEGGKLFKTFVEEIEVKLPLIDFGRFKDMVASYHTLYLDEVICKETYRNLVPNVDPLFEAQQEEEAHKEEEKRIKTPMEKINEEEDNTVVEEEEDE